MKIEYRAYNGDNTSINVDAESRRVEGYAVLFNTESRNMGFVEIIHPEAITEETLKNSDVLCKFNHDSSKVLARSRYGKGSLKLTLDSRGLKYSFDAPKTSLGDELLEYLTRGDVCNSSFAFYMDDTDPSACKWSKRGDKIYKDVYRIDVLTDVSPVFTPAYAETTCSKRFLDIQNMSNEIDAKMNLMLQDIEKL